jgi:choline dehydrogenase-like flavoprotein
LNAQAWIAPSQAGIDVWAKLGNSSWDWAALAPYYKKVHTLHLPPDQATIDHLGIDWVNDEYRGTSGPVQVSFPGVIQNPVGKAWVDAFRGMNKATTAGIYW